LLNATSFTMKYSRIFGETVMFRHEKTFYNPTGIAALVTSDMDGGALIENSRNGTLSSMKG